LLKKIKNFFKVGNIYSKGKNAIQYKVESIRDFSVIINHFDKYCLMTKKQSDFRLFKSGYDLIRNQRHLDKEGLIQLVSNKAVLNNGLPDSLKAAFPVLIPISKPEVKLGKIKDPN
jgi:hypothetical protein